jgi:hypothetical protein
MSEHDNLVGTLIYGKWEDYDNIMLPALDACGAHLGVTPDSGGASVYHHHVQDKPPFMVCTSDAILSLSQS